MTDKPLVLARDDDGWYSLFRGCPKKNVDTGGWHGSDHIECFSPDDFSQMFGCHPLRKGRKAEVESITIKLKGKK